MLCFKSSSGTPRNAQSARSLARFVPSTAIAGSSLAIAILTVVAGLAWTPATFAQNLPTDAQNTAVVPPAVFASWFASGHPTLNGVVNPANSVTFSNNPGLQNVDFYQWSEQMFLWATSPAPASYGGGGGRIFASPTFYGVTPPDASNNRTFIPHFAGGALIMKVRVPKPGPHGLPVIFSKTGKLFEVQPHPVDPAGKPLLMNAEGKSVAVERMTLDAAKKPTFLDVQGNKIASARPIQSAGLSGPEFAQKIVIGNFPIFLDPFGNVIDTEEGQAGGNGVLLTQTGSLVYYATMVNDVYAYFLTGSKGGGITPKPTQFPTTQADLNKIIAFAGIAGPHKKTFPDPDALCIEIKSSWVEAAGLPNLGEYITTMGTVPTYNKANPKLWVPNGQKTVELALVGMHVVGSAKGHPEMIWASFEHFRNAPDAAYTYNSTGGPNPKTVAQNTTGTWLFAKTNASGTFNTQVQGVNASGDISGGNSVIAPGNVLREHPFGASSDQDPNPLVTGVAASNTQIISMNNSVRNQLVGADVRKNYFFLGSTWTIGGAVPTSSFPQGNVVGTSQLANSTLETFQQGTPTFGAFQSCFGCHNGNTTGVSHIYDALKKLY